MIEKEFDDMLEMFISTWSLLGFKNFKEYENYRIDAQEGMIKFGGSFVSFLGYALAHADSSNSLKFLTTFKKYSDEHVELYRKWKEKINNMNTDIDRTLPPGLIKDE